MANYYPLQQSFKGGEISPRLYGQGNTDRYMTSVEEMTNWLALPQGAAMRRQGFGYVARALNDTDVRLLPFKVPRSEDYCLELGPSYLSILSRSGREEFTAGQVLTNGTFSEGLRGWTTSSTTANFYVNTVSDSKQAQFKSAIQNTGPNSIYINQTVDTTSLSGDVTFGYTWALYRLISAIPGPVITMRVTVGTTNGGAELSDVTYTQTDGPILYYTTPLSEITDFVNPTYIEYKGNKVSEVVDIGAANTVYIRVELSLDSGTINPGRLFGLGYVEDITFSGTSVTSETFATPWSEEADLALIQYVSESGGGRMYFTHPNYEPKVLTLDNTGNWSFVDINVTAEPSSWGGGNWPAAVEFYQGRLWLAATPDDPSTIWASKSGDPFDFTTGLNDDDAMELPLSTTGGIKWLKGQKGMVIGTDIGELVITSQGSLITPTDRKSEQQSAWGSVDIQPPLAGNDIVYISVDRTKVRAVNTTFSNASWTSVDLTWVAEHITKSRVIEAVYVQNPNYQLWLLMADGSIIICTYDREHETVGWQRLITSGLFLSITNTNSVSGTLMWAGVRRNERINIEAIDPDESRWQFTDSWVDRPVVPTGDIAVAGGLGHLAGMTVQVIVDGAIEPDKVVSDDGFVLIDNVDGDRAIIGVQYTSTMNTLPLSQGNPGGTSLASKRRYVALSVQLHDSALPLIDGVRPPDRSPQTEFGAVEPNVSGIVDVKLLGWESGGSVTIEQDLPKKCMITALFGKAGVEQT